jgi:hypothetical protein
VANNGKSSRVRSRNHERSNRERRKKHAEKGKMTTGGGHPTWQRRLKSNSESGSAEENWQWERKQRHLSMKLVP